MISGYQFYRIHHSLNLHFTSNFDVLKYGYQSKSVSLELFNNRKDKGRFDIFANKINSDTKAIHFCIANFVHNTDGWIYREYDDADAIYTQWNKYYDSFSYEFKTEYIFLTKMMHEKGIKFNDMLVPTTSGNYPPLLQLLLHNKVTPEFVCTLDSKFEFTDGWYEGSRNDPYVEKEVFILKKYTPLCSVIKNNKRKS